MPQPVLLTLLTATASSFLVGWHFKNGQFLNIQEMLGTCGKIFLFMFAWGEHQLN